MQEIFYTAAFITIMEFGANQFGEFISGEVFHRLKDASQATINFGFAALFLLTPTLIALIDTFLIKPYYLAITSAYVITIDGDQGFL